MAATARNTVLGIVYAGIALSLGVGTASAETPPPGPKGNEIRSFNLKTKGGMTLAVTGTKGDEKSRFLMGWCKPGSWEDLTFEVGNTYDKEKFVLGFFTRGKVATGATGKFEIKKLDVKRVENTGHSIVKSSYEGPATLLITRHDETLGRRHVVATITGKGLKVSDAAQGKTLDVEASFDIEFSCGKKK